MVTPFESMISTGKGVGAGVLTAMDVVQQDSVTRVMITNGNILKCFFIVMGKTLRRYLSEVA
jgi:hypothetical protein